MRSSVLQSSAHSNPSYCSLLEFCLAVHKYTFFAPVTMLTPLRIRRDSGSLKTAVIFILNSAPSPLRYFTECFYMAFSSFRFLIPARCSFPLVYPFLADSPQYAAFWGLCNTASVFLVDTSPSSLRGSDEPYCAQVMQSIL